jgi:peptidoglycan/xylan/chitin deacetylase (PgdA/CDA1 family)
MYHHIDEDAHNDYIVTPETFALQMRTLRDNGFTAITLQQLYDFIDNKTPLPERPVIITFDDGYLSVYTYAFPVLKYYGLHAIAFVIGHNVGQDTYKDTLHPVIPKFSFEQAQTMAGTIDIQSHTYDMHQSAALEPGHPRENILIWPGENEDEYTKTLTADHNRISSAIYAATQVPVTAIAFPHGKYDDLSVSILQSLGVRAFFTAHETINVFTYGKTHPPLFLGRININNNVNETRLLELLLSR